MAVYMSLLNRCPEKGSFTIAEINNSLDQLTSATEKKDRSTILQSILRRTTVIEQKWLVRIIIKELKIGISEKSILNYYHEDAIDLYNVTSNLKKVCEVLKDPEVRISSESVGLFHPIKPMLGSRHLPEQVVKLMEGHQFVIETKYDGERLQVHKDGDNIKFYSRNANDITPIYGEKLIPHILQYVKVGQCILDGELLVWDSITEKFEQFGKLKTFAKYDDGKRALDIGSNYGKQLCYMVFDLLYVNGKQIMDLTLRQRVALLKRCIPTPKEKILEIAPQKQVETTTHIIEALDNAILNGDEGIVVKNLDSVYKPNERKEKWIKLKPEYLEGVGDTLDLLILGGYYGAGVGRRGGTISHFLLGVQKGPNLYYSVARVGSGYSDEELKELQAALAPYWNNYNNHNPPSFFMLADQCKDKPNIWIEPKFSKVLEVKAAQIVTSDKYKAGYTLRFPRVVKIRNDKNYMQCMTMDELVSMSKIFEGRLTKRNFNEKEKNENEVKEKKKRIIPKKLYAVASNFKAADTSNIKVEREIFGQMEFCVMNGDNDFSKEELEILIHQYGGSTTQYPTKDTYAVIAAKETLKVKNIQQKGDIDIIKTKWILDCIGRESLVSLEPRYMIHTSPKTQSVFENDIDQFGDSFTTMSTVESLRELFKNISDNEHKKMQNSQQSIQEELSPPPKKQKIEVKELTQHYLKKPFWSIFYDHVFYLDRYDPVGSGTLIPYSSLELCEKILTFYDAEMSPQLTSRVTHIIIDTNEQNNERYKQILEWKSNLPKSKRVFVVYASWVLESAMKRNDLDELDFQVDLKSLIS
eukprot:TRINITY_DN4012_c0_g1_i3.p1 TRINITY_DN4012_c0_g1~~TRINITY_DN4012_c0_g1_i3.p1  ORF type:complete len:941 (-),score=258.52 TRINITY_DN4012_c0_g1_i3:49-2478(-)